MTFSMSHLLVDSDSVPAGVRRALRSAHAAPPHERVSHLETAARLIHRELGLDCADARELVGLPVSPG